jgi:hypothetical protein
MANLDLYIDTTSCKPVAGFSNSSIIDLPLLIQGDTLNVRIWLMKRTSTHPVTPFEYIPNTDITLQVAIGTRVGTGGTLYTQQYTWTPNSDASNPYFSAQLPMNTSAIDSLLGASSSATAYLEVKYVSGGQPTTVLSQQITINAAVIHNGSITVPAGQTPLSAESAQALFLQRTITASAAAPIIITNGTQSTALYVGSDGALHFDPIA